VTTKERLIVIGNGMAGARFVEDLVARKGCERFDVVVFGDEPYGNYNRILLSNVVAGSNGPKDIFLNPIEWYERNGVSLRAGVRVEAVDREKKIVAAAGGIDEPYDRLVFATGSKPFVPPIAGLTRENGRFCSGIFLFRTLDDSLQIIDYASKAKKAVVLGGGLLGLEAARGLLNRGLEVHVVELMPHPMAVQLDPAAGAILRTTLENMGIRFHLGHSVTEVNVTASVQSVTLNDGRIETCDMFVISAGIRPNVAAARQAGLTVDRGIVVADDLASINDPSVFAIGECAQHRGLVYGLVAPCREQAKVLASRLSGTDPQATYAGSSTSTALKVMGVDLTVLGAKEPADEKDNVVTYSDSQKAVYKKLILREGRVAGAILLGDTSAANTVLRAFHKSEKLTQSPQQLLFGNEIRAVIDRAYSQAETVAKEAEPFEVAQQNSTDEPMKEVIAVIRPERWIKTRSRVEKLGIYAFTQHRVVGRGRQRGLHFLARRGAKSGTGFRYLPKRMVSWIVPVSQVGPLVDAIIDANWSGQIGDGKIFVLPLDGTIQINAEEHGGIFNAEDHVLANA
jgi:nitrite reductase (NADH) large subunit